MPATKAGELSLSALLLNKHSNMQAPSTAAANKVTQQVTYPSNNSLADQLKIVAKRLIKGG